MASARRIEVYFDYISPFAYLASELLPAFAKRHGAALEWRPISMLGLSSFEGGLPYSPAKRAYVGLDALRAAAYHRIPIQMPKPFPVRSEAALRLARVGLENGHFERLHAALFRAAWREQQDLESEAVLARCVSAADGEPAEWLDRARSPEISTALEAETVRAESAGVFGVPTAALDGELFWGIDALPVLAWRLGEEPGSG